jgi:hypothetical protein
MDKGEILLKMIEKELDAIHRIRMGRAKDSSGEVVEYCDFIKGANAAYINMFNTLKTLEKNTPTEQDTEDTNKG